MRGQKPDGNPLLEDAKFLADLLWEDAKKFRGVMEGSAPNDMMELSEHDIWLILENLATSLPPAEWNDEHALTDLFDLRKKFTEMVHPELRVLAQQARRVNRLIPDVGITPLNPEFEAMQRRLKRSDAA